MEIEAVYLVGAFAVRTDLDSFTSIDNNCELYSGEFVLCEIPKKINLNHIQRQGFPFFCGTLELSGEIDIPSDNSVLNISSKGINAIDIRINKLEKTIITQNTLEIENMKGRHKIDICLTNNLRNMLGPHHVSLGHCNVAHRLFYKEDCIWNKNAYWTEDYCFSEFSLGNIRSE